MSSDASATPHFKVSTVQFDPDGDVILVLQSEGTARTARFQVNSNSLCLASSVFRAMLGPNARFKEGTALRSRDTGSPPIEVALAGDDPKAMALLLRIVHLQYYWVPKTLNDEQLYQVAIVSDKYDMRQVLEPWLDHWIPVDTQAGGKYRGHKWLFVAYALDRETLFTQLSKELIQTSVVVNGTLVADLVANVKQSSWPSLGEGISVYAEPFNPYIPQSIIAEMQARHQEALTEMYSYLHKKVQAYLSLLPTQCVHPNKIAICDSSFLGLLQRNFKSLNICPMHQYQATTEQTPRSLQDLNSFVDNFSTPEHMSFGEVTKLNIYQLCRCTHSPTVTIYTVDAHMNTICPNSKCRGIVLNHAKTCSPIPAIKLCIAAKYGAIQGLELGMFRRNNKSDISNAVKEGQDISNTVKEGQDLWDYLEYK